MLKKRLVGVVTVRHGWAVQSFGYRKYLPLGKPEVLIENLDRWGADEILIQCIDCSEKQAGPDFNLLKRLGHLGLSTPLIYGGGIRDAEDAAKVVSMGADRITVDSLLCEYPKRLEALARALGTQAIIASLPVRVNDCSLIWLNHLSRNETSLNETLISSISLDWVSEVMLTDYEHEGFPNSFDEAIPRLFPLKDKPLLLFGGLSEPKQFQNLLSLPNVVAAGIGNFLSYKEHAIQMLKKELVELSIRPARFAEERD